MSPSEVTCSLSKGFVAVATAAAVAAVAAAAGGGGGGHAVAAAAVRKNRVCTTKAALPIFF